MINDPQIKALEKTSEKASGRALTSMETLRGVADALSVTLPKLLDDVVVGVELLCDSTTKHVETLRNRRFALVSEVGQMTKAMNDVRQFFLGPDYAAEQARLKEFVELCERLKALKDSGFLDSVADVMLKLAVPKS